MIPLGAGEIPANGDEVARRISEAISRLLGTQAGRGPKVDCRMESPEVISDMRINLSGIEAAATRAERPAGLTVLGAANVEQFQVTGEPVMVYGAPVKLDINGQRIPMSWARDQSAAIWLVPSDNPPAGIEPPTGNIRISAVKAQLEQALKVVVAQLADKNGAKLKDLRLTLESAGPRAIAVGVDVAASKFMMTAKVRAIADARLDDLMNLTIGDVEVTGEGAAGQMVANMLSGTVKPWRGRQLNLGQYMFAGAALKDVQMQVGDELSLTAKFGGDGAA